MCRNETDWSSTPQNSQSAGKSISTDTDDNGNVIETTELESIQSESITVDAITSSSDQIISKVIAIGVENSPEVPILLSGFNMPTVSHQEFSSAVSTTILPRSKKLKTMQSQKRRLDSYVDYISDQQKARINDTLVKFFYGCNIPLKMVESKLFWNFINAIRLRTHHYLQKRCQVRFFMILTQNLGNISQLSLFRRCISHHKNRN